MPTLYNHIDVELLRYQFMGDALLKPGEKPAFAHGLELYAGRVLGITEPGDIIQLNPSLKHAWDWIQEHYRDIGLSFTNNVVWNDSFEVALEHPDHILSTFIYGGDAFKVRPDKDWFNVVQKMNSKNNFIRLCWNMELPVPKTRLFDNQGELKDLQHLEYPLYLKASVSVSGLGVLRCESEQQLLDNLNRLNPQGAFQIQSEIMASHFLNAQYRVDESGKLKRVAFTAQLLDGNAHNGNYYPAPEEPWEVTEALARYMIDSGMKGFFAFDVALTEDGPILLECNPRFNGSTYPSLVAQKLGITEWVHVNVKTVRNSFGDFHIGDLGYSQKTKKGVVIVNWGTISNNKIGVLFAGGTAECDEMYTRLSKLL